MKDGTNRVEFRESYERVDEDAYVKTIWLRYGVRGKWLKVRSELITWEIPG